jgi:signal transduction histidine kinase
LLLPGLVELLVALKPSWRFGFYLMPRFYQTRLFWGAVASALLLIAWLFHRLRMHELKARYSAVLAERHRISQDTHDTFAQNLAGIALQLDSVTMQLEEIPPGCGSASTKPAT